MAPFVPIPAPPLNSTNLRQQLHYSLRYSLLRLVLVPQVIVWLLGSFAASRIAHFYQLEERDRFMREHILLAQMALQGSEPQALRLQKTAQVLNVIHASESPMGTRYRISSPDGQVLVGGDATIPLPPKAPPTGNQPLFYQSTGKNTLYIAALSADLSPGTPDAARVYLMVAQDATLLDMRVAELARSMVLALAGLAMVFSILIYYSVQRGLQPLHQLGSEIDEMQAGKLHRISFDNAPVEIKAVANAFNQMLDSLDKQVDGERRFINDAAHQLRTPLAGLISQAELAMKESDADKLRARISKMLGAAQRSSHLVQQLLSLARSEGYNPAVQRLRSYDLAALAREVAREWIPKSVVNNIDLGYEGIETIMVRGERLLMREAISNLIDNALNYTTPGCMVTVSVTRIKENGKPLAVLEVADNGPGIPADQLGNVFKRFWRAHEHVPGGCGLGLPLVDRVAVHHGGRASAHSADPHGFIIRLHLPESIEPDEMPLLPDVVFPT